MNITLDELLNNMAISHTIKLKITDLIGYDLTNEPWVNIKNKKVTDIVFRKDVVIISIGR